jgi:hypothetical protein
VLCVSMVAVSATIGSEYTCIGHRSVHIDVVRLLDDCRDSRLSQVGVSGNSPTWSHCTCSQGAP